MPKSTSSRGSGILPLVHPVHFSPLPSSRLTKFLIIALVMLVLAASLISQTLPVDSRKIPMQKHKSWTALRYSPAADTIWHQITLPDRCMEVWCIADSGAVSISPDSLYYKTDKPYAWIKPGYPFKLPTYKATKFYVKRAASGTVTHLNLIFYRM